MKGFPKQGLPTQVYLIKAVSELYPELYFTRLEQTVLYERICTGGSNLAGLGGMGPGIKNRYDSVSIFCDSCPSVEAVVLDANTPIIIVIIQRNITAKEVFYHRCSYSQALGV